MPDADANIPEEIVGAPYAEVSPDGREHFPVIAEVCHLGSRTTLTRGPTMMAVSIAEQPESPRVRLYPPDEALQRAQPLPPRERLVIEDVSQDDWTAFQEALAEK